MRGTSQRQRFTDLTGEIAVLQEEQDSLIEQMRGASAKAEREGRDLYPDEHKEYKKLSRGIDNLKNQIRGVESKRAELQAEMFPDGAPSNPVPHQVGVARLDGTFRPAGANHDAVRAGVLAPEHRVADWVTNADVDQREFSLADADDFCIGNIMRALVDPKFRSELNDVERRALAEGTDSTGGFLTPEILSVNFIDKVRNAGKVFAAGATTVPLDSDTHSIPRLATDPTFGWRNEAAAFNDTNGTFERVTFTPRSGGFIVKTSEELFQDMIPGSGRIIEKSLVQTAALELDRVALRGTGTPPEPDGIRNQSGVTIQSLGANGATPTRYTEVMTALTTLLTANRNPNAWLLAPRTSQFYGGLADTTNQPLRKPDPVAELTPFVTSQIPVDITQGTSTDTSEIYVGEWADLLVGIRLGIQLRLLTERYADNGQYAWRVFLRADVQLAHPESFVVITGVRP